MDDQHHHQLIAVNQSSSPPTVSVILKYVVKLLDINMDILMLFNLIAKEVKASMEHMLMALALLMEILVNMYGHLWLLYKRTISIKMVNTSVPVLLTVLSLSHLLLVMTTSVSQVVQDTGRLVSSILIHVIHSGMINSVD